ncbi:MAG: hypothetical protein WEB88_04350, partial [Gemmatimonadota bacterium]
MQNGYAAAALLGAGTGIRSMAGLAMLATSDAAPRNSPFRSVVVRAGALAAITGEALADKFAPLPPRTGPLPLAGRMVLAAAAAGVAARWRGRDPLVPALIGAGTAAATAWAATAVRGAAERHGLPDAWPALGEDAVVVAVGRATHGQLQAT